MLQFLSRHDDAENRRTGKLGTQSVLEISNCWFVDFVVNLHEPVTLAVTGELGLIPFITWFDGVVLCNSMRWGVMW